MVAAVKGHILHQLTKFHKDWSNHYGDIAIFVIFQDCGRRHFGFSKILNFNGRSAVTDQYASPCQILSKSFKPLQRYRDFCDFQNGGCRHLEFSKIQNFNGRSVVRGRMCVIVPNFIKIGQTVAEIW